MPIRIVLLALAFALATAAFGWWTVPLLGAVWGWIAPRDSRAVLTASGAAALGWTILLVWTATRGPLVALAGKVGGIMSLPGWTLILLTVVFEVMLPGSAAGVLGALRDLTKGERGKGKGEVTPST